MASGGGPSIEEEEQNFTRIQIALSYCGIAVLKELFLQRVRDLSPPNQPNGCWTVDEFLFEKMYVILRSIGNDSHKKNILYRQNTDLEKWDVSLFVHVLLAACDISAAGGTLRHDITNLSSLRNKLCHTPHPKLSAVIYNGYIGRVRGSINRICAFLNNQTLTQNVNETLDKYESLTHAYPNGVLEEYVKYNDIVSEDDLAVTGALEQIEQLINERGTRIQIPVIEVVLLLRHYNREDEERVSNYLRELFANAVQQSTLQEEASQAVADLDREGRGEQGDRDRDVADIVNHLVQELFREKRKVTYAKQRCVILGIQVPDIGSAITLIDDIISGRMYSLFAPLEEMMRTQKGHELFDIYVTMERKTTYTFLNEIVSQITSSRSLSPKMTLSVKQDDVCTDAVRCVYHPSSYIERGQVINDLISKEKSELYQTTVDEIRRVLEIPKLEMNVFIEDTSCPKSVVLSVDKTFPVTQSTLTWLEWALRGLKALPIWKAIGLDFTGELDVDSLRSEKMTENSKTPVNIKQEIAEKALKARSQKMAENFKFPVNLKQEIDAKTIKASREGNPIRSNLLESHDVFQESMSLPVENKLKRQGLHTHKRRWFSESDLLTKSEMFNREPSLSKPFDDVLSSTGVPRVRRSSPVSCLSSDMSEGLRAVLSDSSYHPPHTNPKTPLHFGGDTTEVSKRMHMEVQRLPDERNQVLEQLDSLPGTPDLELERRFFEKQIALQYDSYQDLCMKSLTNPEISSWNKDKEIKEIRAIKVKSKYEPDSVKFKEDQTEPTDAPTLKKLGEMELLGTDGHVEFGIISGMTVVGDRFLVAADYAQCVRCFDMDSGKQQVRWYESKFLPVGITTIPGKRVAVTSHNEVRFLRVTEKGDLLFESKIDVEKPYYSIASSGDNLIGCYYKYPDHGVQILDMKGNVIKEFEKDDDGEKLFKRPASLAVSPDHSTIYIADCLKNTVTSLTQDGRILGVVDVKVNRPCGSIMTVDSAGRVYVCGHDNVFLVSPETRTVIPLLGIKDGIWIPISVAVCDKTQRLYLTSCNNSLIQVFEMPKHTTA